MAQEYLNGYSAEVSSPSEAFRVESQHDGSLLIDWLNIEELAVKDVPEPPKFLAEKIIPNVNPRHIPLCHWLGTICLGSVANAEVGNLLFPQGAGMGYSLSAGFVVGLIANLKYRRDRNKIKVRQDRPGLIYTRRRELENEASDRARAQEGALLIGPDDLKMSLNSADFTDFAGSLGISGPDCLLLISAAGIQIADNKDNTGVVRVSFKPSICIKDILGRSGIDKDWLLASDDVLGFLIDIARLQKEIQVLINADAGIVGDTNRQLYDDKLKKIREAIATKQLEILKLVIAIKVIAVEQTKIKIDDLIC